MNTTKHCNTWISLTNIDGTIIEHLLYSAVSRNNLEGNFKTPIFDDDTADVISLAIQNPQTIPAVFFLSWQPTTDVGLIQMQYVASLNEFSEDVEFIFRYSVDGDRTIIAITSDSNDDDYENADIDIWFNGTEEGLRKELSELAILPENIAIWSGDTLPEIKVY